MLNKSLFNEHVTHLKVVDAKPMTSKALMNLQPLFADESTSIRLLCCLMIRDAVAPNMFDELIAEQTNDQAIIEKCNDGYYQSMIEKALDGVDVIELFNESQKIELNLTRQQLHDIIMCVDYAKLQARTSCIVTIDIDDENDSPLAEQDKRFDSLTKQLNKACQQYCNKINK